MFGCFSNRQFVRVLLVSDLGPRHITDSELGTSECIKCLQLSAPTDRLSHRILVCEFSSFHFKICCNLCKFYFFDSVNCLKIMSAKYLNIILT